MSQGPFCPNLSQKVQAEVSQMANRNLSRVILLGGLSVNLNHLKTETFSLKDPSFAREFFACQHFKSDIRKDNRRSHVKLDNILFYLFKKEKMK